MEVIDTGRYLWSRIPETIRALGLFALIVDVVAVPSGVVMAVHHTLHVVMPWSAWLVVMHLAHVRHTFLIVAIALVAGAVYWGYALQKEGSGGASHTADDAFGSARWRTSARELAQSLQRWRVGGSHNPVGLVAGAGSARGPIKTAWVLGQDGHNLLLGAPGAGKSLKVILPSLAVIAEGGENLVVTDPKGELRQAMLGYLIAHHYEVATLDLRFPPHSLRWNPLEPIAQAMADHRWSEATRMANDLANILATQGTPGGDNGAFWQQSARAIGAALALYVADQAPPDARHVASMYHLLTQRARHLDALMQALPLEHPARQAWGPLLTGSDETRQNQMNVVAVSLSLFADANIAWLTGASGWDARRLLSPRTAVFIVVPDDTTTYYPLASLFVTQILQTLANAASGNSEGKLKVPVHLVLDEFGNLPKIPEFDKALAVARGRGLRITLTLQSLAQLDVVYGQKASENMRNNCNTWVYLSSNDNETARIVSEKVGQSTIETTSRGSNWQTGSSASHSENTNRSGRALLTPDEVLRWQPIHTLVMQMGQQPAKLPARVWMDWPQYAEAQAAPRPNLPDQTIQMPALWIPPEPQEPQGTTPQRVDLNPSGGHEEDDEPFDPEAVMEHPLRRGWAP